MALTESDRNKLYYEKHKETIIARKCEYQKKNKDKIAQQRAQQRKERRIAKMKENKTVLTTEQNVAQTRTWWGRP